MSLKSCVSQYGQQPANCVLPPSTSRMPRRTGCLPALPPSHSHRTGSVSVDLFFRPRTLFRCYPPGFPPVPFRFSNPGIPQKMFRNTGSGCDPAASILSRVAFIEYIGSGAFPRHTSNTTTTTRWYSADRSYITPPYPTPRLRRHVLHRLE